MQALGYLLGEPPKGLREEVALTVGPSHGHALNPQYFNLELTALAIGALAIGALAIGALAIGALAIGLSRCLCNAPPYDIIP